MGQEQEDGKYVEFLHSDVSLCGQENQSVNIKDEILDEEEQFINEKTVLEELTDVKQRTQPIIEDTFSVATNRTRRLRRCGTCTGCLKKDCGACCSCQEMRKFGGQGRFKQACLQRFCGRLQSAKVARSLHLSRGNKVRRVNKCVEQAFLSEALFSPPSAHPICKRRWLDEQESLSLLKVKFVGEQSHPMMVDCCPWGGVAEFLKLKN